MAITRRASTNSVFLLLCIGVLSCEATQDFNANAEAISPGNPSDPAEKVFNVLQFGAKIGDQEDPGNIESNNKAFVQAFQAACTYEGKATFLIPKGTFVLGQVTFVGPCKKPTLIVQVEGTLKAITDISKFHGQAEEWVNFESINGLTVTGGGTFDGQGSSSWKYRDSKNNNGKPGQRLPASVQFKGVTNAFVQEITSINSKGFHLFITHCQNISLSHLNITAPDESPNTDGIHIGKSNLVKIANSSISTGDDCVGMVRGSTNISIEKVTCGPGHGISVGSLGKYDGETDVKGIIVRDCTFVGTDNGVRIKTFAGKCASQASDILFQDIVMNDVKRPIIINQFYGGKKDSIVKINDIRFINITGTSISKVAVDIACSKQFPCQNVQLSNVNLKYSGVDNDNSPFSSSCVNAQVGYHGMQFPPPCH